MRRLLAIAVGTALLLTLPASARHGSASAFLGLARPSSLALVDANGDGKVDVISANVHSSMSVFVGVGDGSLGRYVLSPLRGGHPDLATADFNGDRRPDYVVADYEGAVFVLLGSQSGVSSPTAYQTATGTVGTLAADFNRDGKEDIAALSSKRGNLTVLLGNGDGTFGTPARYPVGGEPWEVAAADLNRDGILDVLATTGLPDELRILFGTATGGFLPPRVYAAGDLPTGIATGDFDGDGNTDVALASFGEDFVSVLLGDGTGAFRSVVNYRAVGSPDSLVAADLTGDGRLDLAAAPLLLGNRGAVLQGRGDGTFSVPMIVPLGGPAFDLEQADLNVDGKPDLVAALPFTGHVSVLLGRGGGVFGSPVRYVAGPPVCIVPDLRRKTLAQARRLLRAGGCRLGRVRTARSKAPRGRVVKQRPARYSEMPRGSRVGVTISRGSK